MQPGGAIQPEYFEIVDAGRYLGMVKEIPGDPNPKKTQYNQLQKLYRWVAQGRVPVIRMGSRLYFSKIDLDSVMRSGAQQPCRTSQLPEHVLRSLNQSHD
jgi:hypothetical protein